MFERNFDVPVPECTRKGGNAYSVEANPYVKRDDEAKKVPRQKKRGRNTEELLTTGDVRDIQSVPENQSLNKAKTKKSKKEETDACSSTNLNHEEIVSNKSEAIQKTEDIESKKSKKKKKSKHKDIPEMEENNEIREINENTENGSTKKKKKKGEEKFHVTQKEQDDTELLTKKRKKKQIIDTIQIDNSAESKECEGETEKKKKKKKKKRM